jgi:hypothetical protein
MPIKNERINFGLSATPTLLTLIEQLQITVAVPGEHPALTALK